MESNGTTKSWLNVAGPYVAAIVAVGIALTGSLLNDRANAMERIAKLETHQSDVDVNVTKRLDNIDQAIRDLGAKIDKRK